MTLDDKDKTGKDAGPAPAPATQPAYWHSHEHQHTLTYPPRINRAHAHRHTHRILGPDLHADEMVGTHEPHRHTHTHTHDLPWEFPDLDPLHWHLAEAAGLSRADYEHRRAWGAAQMTEE